METKLRFIYLCLVTSALISGCGGGSSEGGKTTSSNATLVKLELSPSKSPVHLGDVFYISATGTYSDGSTKTDISAYAENPTNSLAFPITGSNIEAVQTGTTVITATPYGDNPNKVSGKLSLEVKANSAPALLLDSSIYKPVVSLGILKITQNDFNVGDVINITDKALNTAGSSQALSEGVTFLSSADAIAAVSAAGTVSASSKGKATITAKYGTVEKAVTLDITKPLDKPFFTIKCNELNQKISVSDWKGMVFFDSQDILKWLDFDSQSCAAESQWALTSSTGNSTTLLHLVKSDKLLYRYKLLEVAAGDTLDIGRLDDGAGYTKTAKITFN